MLKTSVHRTEGRLVGVARDERSSEPSALTNDYRAMRSQLAPMKRVAKTLRAQRALLLNWCKAKGEIALGVVDGLQQQCHTYP